MSECEMGSRAIVTGASGFIGQALVAELSENGYEVIAVVHNESGRIRAEHAGASLVVECDLSSYGSLAIKSNVNADVFFHLAWRGVSGLDAKNSLIQLENIVGTIEAIRAASELGCKRFIGAGTIHEAEGIREIEKSGRPATAYKTAKIAAHYLAQSESERLGIDFFWPTITNAYGPGEHSPRLINTFIRKLITGEEMDLTSGEQLYNFIYVDDAARAFRLIAESGKPSTDYIIGTSDVRPLREYLEEARDIISPGTELGFGRLSKNPTYLNKSDLMSFTLLDGLEFKPAVSFECGIRNLISAL